MKSLLVGLLVLFLVLQYQLWFGAVSVFEYRQLRAQAGDLQAEMSRLSSRNSALMGEIADLKSGLDAIEERARSDLGMIREGETFYQFIRQSPVQHRQ